MLETTYTVVAAQGVNKRSELQYLVLLNPLSPHDALKHHFTSLKTDLIFHS